MNVFEGVQGMILFVHHWLCEWKCSHFALIHSCPLSPSQAAQFQVAVSYHYIFCPFFLIGTCLCNISFPIPSSLFVPTTISLIFQLCIPVPVAHPVRFQKPVFSCLVLLFLSPQYSLYSFHSIHTSCLFSQCIHCLMFSSASSPCPSQIPDWKNTVAFSCQFKAPYVDPKQWRISHLPSEKLDFGVVIALEKPLFKWCCYIRLLALLSVFEQVFKHPGYRRKLP